MQSGLDKHAVAGNRIHPPAGSWGSGITACGPGPAMGAPTGTRGSQRDDPWDRKPVAFATGDHLVLVHITVELAAPSRLARW